MDGPPPRHFFGGLREPLGQRVARGDQRGAALRAQGAVVAGEAIKVVVVLWRVFNQI